MYTWVSYVDITGIEISVEASSEKCTLRTQTSLRWKYKRVSAKLHLWKSRAFWMVKGFSRLTPHCMSASHLSRGRITYRASITFCKIICNFLVKFLRRLRNNNKLLLYFRNNNKLLLYFRNNNKLLFLKYNHSLTCICSIICNKIININII